MVDTAFGNPHTSNIARLFENNYLVGSAAVFEEIFPLAQQIQETERKLLDGITAAGGSSKTIADMSNSDEHILERQKGSPSTLQFRVS
ncbi:hypothetical protein IV203_035792 [Nitzschia inconspicua]|uniref:Uncharacterized protein n=1 Tax=Nitzschia inconspicua TaxID=303405 RepID=A0A9K3LFP0_9STRA|nr:hypothetical protein IV203_035792 [Nitzschia inconspicua]